MSKRGICIPEENSILSEPTIMHMYRNFLTPQHYMFRTTLKIETAYHKEIY
jgi:hypothetical protein